MFLRYSADRRTLFVVGVWVTVELIAWQRVLDASALTAGLFVLACVGSFQGAVAAHNAIHCPVFARRRVEHVYRCILTLVYGHPVSAFVPVHNLSHHRHLESSRDVMRTSKATSRWNLLNLLFFTARISGDLWRAELRYLTFAWHRRARWRRQLLGEVAALVPSLIVLAVLDYRKFLVFVVLPHLYAAWGIVTMNLLQHDGTDMELPHRHSRNFVGPIVNWLSFNNGFHAVHHAHPNLHWSRAPAAHERLSAPHVPAELIESSLLAYVVRAYVYPGQRKRYDGAPVPVRIAGRDSDWYTTHTPQPEAGSPPVAR